MCKHLLVTSSNEKLNSKEISPGDFDIAFPGEFLAFLDTFSILVVAELLSPTHLVKFRHPKALNILWQIKVTNQKLRMFDLQPLSVFATNHWTLFFTTVWIHCWWFTLTCVVKFVYKQSTLVSPNQCDQIMQNFVTLANFKSLWQLFKGLFSV